jgi:hypothetical protein
MMDSSTLPHPLLASPIEGEVSLHSWGTIWSNPQGRTSPLMGEVRRGWGPERDLGVTHK